MKNKHALKVRTNVRAGGLTGLAMTNHVRRPL